MDFAIPANHRIKLEESEKKDKYFDLVRELKKMWTMKVTFIPIVNSTFITVTEGLLKRLGGFGNKRSSGDRSNYYTIEIYQKTEKNPGDLRGLTVPQTSVKDHQLTLIWKTLKE